MRNRKHEYVGPAPVPAGKEKVTFKLTVEGEWDFNKDLTADAFNGDSMLASQSKEETFKKAFFAALAAMMYSRTENMFSNIRLVEVVHSDEAERSYQDMRKVMFDKRHKEATDALAKAEAEAERLRGELSKGR